MRGGGRGCVCMHASVRALVCVRVCARVRAYARAGACACACVREGARGCWRAEAIALLRAALTALCRAPQRIQAAQSPRRARSEPTLRSSRGGSGSGRRELPVRSVLETGCGDDAAPAPPSAGPQGKDAPAATYAHACPLGWLPWASTHTTHTPTHTHTHAHTHTHTRDTDCAGAATCGTAL